MDIQFSPSDHAFRDQVRTWLAENTPAEPRPFDSDEAKAFDLAWQAKQYQGGWAGISWPQAYGGRGLSLIQQIIWFEEYARADAPWIGACFVGVNHGGPTLIMCGDDAQKSDHLPRILKGETVWCQGFSEPGAGSDLAGIRTTARLEGDELVVNGQKLWTSFAHQADYQELLLRTDPEAGRHAGLSWVICDMRSPGITVRPIRMMSGEADFCEVFYDEVRIPVSNVVGGLNRGWSVAMSTLGFERGTGFIAEQVKLAREVEALLKVARERTDERGRPLIANERVAEDLALLRVEVAALRALTYANVSLAARAGAPGAEASVVRLFSAELTQRIARLQTDLLGPEMLDFEYGQWGTTQHYLRTFAATIAGGTAQIQRDIIGERLLGLPKSR